MYCSEGKGPFRAVVDDLYVGAPADAARTTVEARPDSGSYPAPLKVELRGDPKSTRIRYTLDGASPSETSPVYEKPILFDKAGAYEVRFQAVDAGGKALTPVTSRLYDVR